MNCAPPSLLIRRVAREREVLLSPQASPVPLPADAVRQEHEENCLSAMFQYWHAAKDFYAFAPLMLFPARYFGCSGRVAIVKALVLSDGDGARAVSWLQSNYALPDCDWRAVLIKARTFPMHPRGALKSAEWLTRKERAA
jgi:hypothetical protein